MIEEIKYNEDKNFIKIWPYLDDISQAIFPYSSKRLSKDRNMVVNLDFSNVKRINSSGAAILLKKLISIAQLDKVYRPFKLNMPKDNSVEKYMQSSGFLSILDNSFHFGKYHGNLFEQIQSIEINKITENFIEEQSYIKKTSFPIFHLKFNPEKERESVDKFSEWLDNNVLSILDNYDVKTDVLFSIFTEIAKNSQDHTENDAFFGIDLLENTYTKRGEILFSCSDLGIGISQKVKNFLDKNPKEDPNGRRFHLDVTEAYKWAFTLGNTTSKKTTNKGIGMTMIIDGAHNLNMDLSFFDNLSLMQIPESLFYSPDSLTHSELRTRFFNTKNDVGFYYYGQLKF